MTQFFIFSHMPIASHNTVLTFGVHTSVPGECDHLKRIFNIPHP